LALRQSGFEPVVASLGTALTERHLNALSPLARRRWRCVDGDAAGEAAALGGVALAGRQGLAVRVGALAAGPGPCAQGAALAGALSPKLLERGDRLERGTLAGVIRYRGLAPALAEMTPDHFDSEQHRVLQAHLGRGGEPPAELIGLVADLDALAEREAIDEDTA